MLNPLPRAPVFLADTVPRTVASARYRGAHSSRAEHCVPALSLPSPPSRPCQQTSRGGWKQKLGLAVAAKELATDFRGLTPPLCPASQAFRVTPCLLLAPRAACSLCSCPLAVILAPGAVS